MKKATEIMLDAEIRSGKYFYGDDRTAGVKLKELFEKYIITEFDSFDEFLTAFKVDDIVETEFFNFVFNYFDYFGIAEQAIYATSLKSPENLLRRDLTGQVRKVKIYDNEYKRTKKFVNTASGVTNGGVLLDVGSGTSLPLSSLEFARVLQSPVDSMDKFCEYWNDLSVFEKMKVNLISDLFDNFTDISKYDRIVGECPCSAIEPIVDKCANRDDKEYFITMCDCCSPRNGITGFVEHLKEKDKNLRHFVVENIYDAENDVFLNGKNFYINKEGDLDGFNNIVYVTNSHKHNDDIMNVIYEEQMKYEQERCF